MGKRHMVHYGAENRLLTETLTTENLEKAAPRLADFHEGIHEWQNMQNEISAIGTYCRKTGFTPGKDFQRVATIPTSVKKAVQEIIPDAFENKEVFYSLLAGPLKQYDTRNKTVV